MPVDNKDHIYWAKQAKEQIRRMRLDARLFGNILSEDWAKLDEYLGNMIRTMPEDK